MFELLSLVHKALLKLNLIKASILLLPYFVRKKLGTEKRVILSLGKPVFNEDVSSLHEFSGLHTYATLPKFFLDRYVEHCVPFHKGLSDATYWPHMENSHHQKKLYKIMELIFKHLQKKIRFDAILSGNFVYVGLQEFFIIAKKNNIPSIVIYKEGMYPPERFFLSKDRLYQTKKCFVSKVLVYNKNIKNMLSDANIHGLSSENIEIIGIPRFDISFKNSKQIRGTDFKKITLFFFDVENKANYLVDESEDIDAYKFRLSNFQKWLVEYAVENKDVQLLIKTKSSKTERESVLRFIEREVKNKLPKNIKISFQNTSREIIEWSDLVAGYSSTTLIEALLYKKNIIEPYLEDIEKVGSFSFFKEYSNMIRKIKSKEHLYKHLKALQSQGIKKDIRKMDNILIPLIHNINGTASKNAENIIEEIIKRNYEK